MIKKVSTITLSAILCVLLVVSSFPAFAVESDNKKDIVLEYTTYDNDYIPIYTKMDFYNIRNNTKGKYYLANDLVFTEKDFIITGEFNGGFEAPDAFYGELDGCGHTIIGLKADYGIANDIYGSVKNIEFKNCYFSISAFSNSVYGKISNCIIDGCTADEAVVANTNMSDGIIEYCVVKNLNPDKEYNYVEWLYSNRGIFRNCVNFSDLYGKSAFIMASFIFYNSGKVEECINFGNVYNSDAGSSGIVAYNRYAATIKRCVNYGKITGYQAAGINKLTYEDESYVEDSINKGVIYGQRYESYGITDKSALNCVNVGEVVNKDYRTNVYPISDVFYNPYNCYYLKDSANNNVGGTALTAEQMGSKDSFKDFDFENVWQIKDGQISLQMENERAVAIAPYVYPEKTRYILGEEIDLSDMVVMEFNNYGDKEIVYDYTVQGDTNSLGSNIITVSRGNNAFSFIIDVYDDIENQEVTLSATSFDYNGKAVKPKVKVISKSGKTLIENRDYTVEYSNNLNIGTGEVRVTGIGNYVGSVTRNFEIEPVPTSVSLNVSSLTMAVGETYKLRATVFPNGVNTDYIWSSSNINTATVDKGEITAVSQGTSYIKVKTKNGKEATCTVKVLKAPSKISLNKSKITLGLGEKFDLDYKIPSGQYSKSIKFFSDNTDIATVDSKGIVKTKGTGKATIYVETFNNKQAKCVITVKKAPTKITLNKKSKSLKKGKSFTVKAKFKSGQYSNKITFKSSNKKVATVNSKGVVKAKKKGITTITVKTFNGKTSKCKITVK